MRFLVQLALLVFLLTDETAAAPAICDPKRDGQATTELSELQEASSDSEFTKKVDIKTLTSTHFQLSNGTKLQVHPISQPLFKFTNGTRRKLGNFRECSPCTCCDSTRQWCLPTVCCYNIDCGVRGLPFGLCSFTPISCTCLGCRD